MTNSDFEISAKLVDEARNVLFPLHLGMERGDGLPHNLFESVLALVRREFHGLSEVEECSIAANLIERVETEHAARAPEPLATTSGLRDDIVTHSGAQAAHRPDHGGLRNGTIGMGEDCFHEVPRS